MVAKEACSCSDPENRAAHGAKGHPAGAKACGNVGKQLG